MAIPKCDICGTRHGPKQAHVFASTDASLVEGPDLTATDVRARLSGDPPPGPHPDMGPVAPILPAEKVSENDSPALSQSERNARYRLKNREKYNAYMRDYRKRNRRAKSK